jgi:hypothetical protein
MSIESVEGEEPHPVDDGQQQQLQQLLAELGPKLQRQRFVNTSTQSSIAQITTAPSQR